MSIDSEKEQPITNLKQAKKDNTGSLFVIIASAVGICGLIGILALVYFMRNRDQKEVQLEEQEAQVPSARQLTSNKNDEIEQKEPELKDLEMV